MYKLIVAIFFFLGLSWLNLFITTPTVAAARKTADEVYVQPIKGLEKSGLFGPHQSEIIEALVFDNYQVYCAAPAQEMEAQIGKEYIRYLELEYGNLKLHKIETTMTGSDDIFNPLVLDDSGESPTSALNETKPSYVQYFNNSKTSDDPLLQNLVTADYYKLLSLEEQLAFKKEIQGIIADLCGKTDDPLSKCPLNIRVPNIEMEIGEINIPDYWDDLINDPVTRKKVLSSLDAIGTANIPLSKVYGKRPAYLVTCVEQQKSGASDARGKTGLEDLALYVSTSWDNILSSFFGSLFKNLYLKKDECHVRTILVDAATTEDEAWNSVEAHNLSRKIFTPLENQIALKDEYNRARGAMNDIAQGELADGFDADDRVNLVGTTNIQTQALIHMVNGLAPICGNGNIRTETSPTITSEANFPEGGPNYIATGRTADEDWGLLDSLKAKLKAQIETGKRTLNDISNRSALLETFLIAPYDAQITMDQFFSPMEEYKITRQQAETIWPTHVLFNKGVGEGEEYRLIAGTTKSNQKFEDPDDCRWVEGHTQNEYNGGGWIAGHWDCTKTYGVGISGADQPLGVAVLPEKTQRNGAGMLFSLPYNSPAYNHVLKYSSSDEANSEKLIKGEGDGSSNNAGGGTGEELLCQEIKSLTTVLPTRNELVKMVCDVADNANDAQMLWGFLVLESGLTSSLGDERKTISCGDLIVNDCGASEIMGVLIPQCIDTNPNTSGCPNFAGAVKIANDYEDKWIIEARENPDVACDVKTQMQYILDKRKDETTFLTTGFKDTNGRLPSDLELHRMMAGRNLGVTPTDGLFELNCGVGKGPVDGCDGMNYCQCAMDHPGFQFGVSCN